MGIPWHFKQNRSFRDYFELYGNPRHHYIVATAGSMATISIAAVVCKLKGARLTPIQKGHPFRPKEQFRAAIWHRIPSHNEEVIFGFVKTE